MLNFSANRLVMVAKPLAQKRYIDEIKWPIQVTELSKGQESKFMSKT